MSGDVHTPRSGLDHSPLRLGILVSGRGSNFQAIQKAIDSGDLAARVVVVVSNRPGVLAIARAETIDIPIAVHERRDFPSRHDRDQEIVKTLREHDVELVVSAGYSAVISAAAVEAYRDRIINIHPSLLPAFAGGMAPKPQTAALRAGVKISGCTVHFVTDGVDSGPIIAQAAVPVLDDDTPASLASRILEEEHLLLPLAIGWLGEGILKIRNGRVRGCPATAGSISRASIS